MHICLIRADFTGNLLSQCGHLYGFSPVWGVDRRDSECEVAYHVRRYKHPLGSRYHPEVNLV